MSDKDPATQIGELAQAFSDAMKLPALEQRPNGSLIWDGVAIGLVHMAPAGPVSDALQTGGPELVLNLGWLRAAGLSITVQGDPEQDHQRGGIVLKR